MIRRCIYRRAIIEVILFTELFEFVLLVETIRLKMLTIRYRLIRISRVSLTLIIHFILLPSTSNLHFFSILTLLSFDVFIHLVTRVI
jgi:hypothetical protein